MAIGRRKYMMHGLYEVDVTEDRQILRQRGLLFSAFIVACVARAVVRHPLIHAYRDWRGRLIAFDEVDVTVIAETAAGGRTFPLAHVLRSCERRSVAMENWFSDLRLSMENQSTSILT